MGSLLWAHLNKVDVILVFPHPEADTGIALRISSNGEGTFVPVSIGDGRCDDSLKLTGTEAPKPFLPKDR